MKSSAYRLFLTLSIASILAVFSVSPLYAQENTSSSDTDTIILTQSQESVQNGTGGLGDPFKRLLKGWAINKIFGIAENNVGSGKHTPDMMSIMYLHVANMILGDACFNKVGEAAFQGVRLQDCKEGDFTTGLIGNVSAQFATVIDNPPNMNTASIIRGTLANNLLNPEPAYAQDYLEGSDFFQGTQAMWGIMLDIALGLSLLLLIATGFMIMFSGVGVIGPKMKVTVLSSLPNVFLALFFAVFSFLIASLLFDLVNVIGIIVLSLIETQARDMGVSAAVDPGFGLRSLATGFFWPLMKAAFAFNGDGIDLTGFLLAIIVGIVGLYYGLRLFFTLIVRYASLYMIVMFSPIILIFAALPGKQGIIKKWIYLIVGNAAIFPVVLIILTTGKLLISGAVAEPIGADAFGGSPVLWFTGSGTFLGIIALGFLAAAHRIPKTMISMFGLEAHALLADLKGFATTGAKGVPKDLGNAWSKIDKYAVAPALEVSRTGGLKKGADGKRGRGLIKPGIDALPEGAQKIILRNKKARENYQRAAVDSFVAKGKAAKDDKTLVTAKDLQKKTEKKYKDDLKANRQDTYKTYEKNVRAWIPSIGAPPGIQRPNPPKKAVENAILLGLVHQMRADNGWNNPGADRKQIRDQIRDELFKDYGYDYRTDSLVDEVINSDSSQTDQAKIPQFVNLDGSYRAKGSGKQTGTGTTQGGNNPTGGGGGNPPQTPPTPVNPGGGATTRQPRTRRGPRGGVALGGNTGPQTPRPPQTPSGGPAPTAGTVNAPRRTTSTGTGKAPGTKTQGGVWVPPNANVKKQSTQTTTGSGANRGKQTQGGVWVPGNTTKKQSVNKPRTTPKTVSNKTGYRRVNPDTGEVEAEGAVDIIDPRQPQLPS